MAPKIGKNWVAGHYNIPIPGTVDLMFEIDCVEVRAQDPRGFVATVGEPGWNQMFAVQV